MNFIKRMKDDIEYRRHIITYFAFGIVTTLVSWGSFYLIRQFMPFVNENVANIISIILAVITAYVVNRIYVFKSEESNIIKEFLAFCSTRAATMIFEAVFFYLFATLFGVNEMIVKVVISIIIVVLNYILSRLFVFKKI